MILDTVTNEVAYWILHQAILNTMLEWKEEDR